ncbi:GMC oxidoreductase [Actinoplanes sp. NPDC051851]|uniref:GMC oxidoreductase n=1 Tax=Actinoplanes sp. NPDC051851 TaxID=3154753 RepID=UPI00343E0CE8
MSEVDLLIVGSGPVGATYARLVSERLPGARVLMVERGPLVTEPPGRNVRNLGDPDAQATARERSQGSHAARATGTPYSTGETITARPGTHLIADMGTGDFPAAAVSTCVGGQGAHWTCATPRPYGSERADFIPDLEWNAAVETAEGLLHTTAEAFGERPITKALRSALAGVFDDELPAGRKVGLLPVACTENPDGTVEWTGTGTILAPLTGNDQFELRAGTACVRLDHEDGRVTAAELEEVATGRRYTVRPRAVVVAADALRTPQLLWASGIRPHALGRYLNEHPLMMGVVALAPHLRALAGDDSGDAPAALLADPVRGALTVPFADEAHPFQGQIMYYRTPPVPAPSPATGSPATGFAAVGWGCRQEPRPENRIEFSPVDVDETGLPAMTIHWSLSERDRDELIRARANLDRAAAALGTFLPDAQPRIMPPGSSLHYQGTLRMGPADDGTSVCSTESRVWGTSNLFAGGNGLIPTGTACNPTLTSVAFAVLGAAAIVEDLS